MRNPALHYPNLPYSDLPCPIQIRQGRADGRQNLFSEAADCRNAEGEADERKFRCYAGDALCRERNC